MGGTEVCPLRIAVAAFLKPRVSVSFKDRPGPSGSEGVEHLQSGKVLEMPIRREHRDLGFQSTSCDEVILRGEDDAAAVEFPGQLLRFLPYRMRGSDEVHQRESGFQFGQLRGIAHAAQHFEHDHATGEEFPIPTGGSQFPEGITARPEVGDVKIAVDQDSVDHGMG